MRQGLLQRQFSVCAALVAVSLVGTTVPAFAQEPSAAPALASDRQEVAAITAGEASRPPYSRLFSDTLTDFRRLPSRDTFVWLGVGAGLTTLVATKDAGLSGSIGSNGLRTVFKPGDAIGGAPLQLGGAVAAYTLGRLRHSPRTMSFGAALLEAQAVAQAMTFSVKRSVRRTRPNGDRFSFPSGHTSASFASATVLQRHFGWKVGAIAYGVASYVAASRVQARRHYPSDVVFGAALGVVAGRTVTIGRGGARFALTPAATSSGVGISFTLVNTAE
jgi:membrane-associated phospholipid phosphatase